MTKKRVGEKSINSVPRPRGLARYNSTTWWLSVVLSCAATNAAAHELPEQDIEEIVVVGRWTDLAGSAISA